MFAAMPLPGLEERGALSSVSIPFSSAYVRALRAVAELLQPGCRRSSSCLHRALPPTAAAGSCLKRQQRGNCPPGIGNEHADSSVLCLGRGKLLPDFYSVVLSRR